MNTLNTIESRIKDLSDNLNYLNERLVEKIHRLNQLNNYLSGAVSIMEGKKEATFEAEEIEGSGGKLDQIIEQLGKGEYQVYQITEKLEQIDRITNLLLDQLKPMEEKRKEGVAV